MSTLICAVVGECVLRSGDDDLGVNEFLVELAVLTLLVRGGDESVALLLNPLPQTKLVLSRAQKLRLLLGVLVALDDSISNCNAFDSWNRASYSMQMQAEEVLTSYKTRRTLPCRDEVAVSVLTPPKLAVLASEAPRCENAGVTLWASRELAGRAARKAERVNTIVIECPVVGDGKVQREAALLSCDGRFYVW